MIVNVHKKTGTYADSLEAIGVASLVAEMASAPCPPSIIDRGTHFAVEGSADQLTPVVSPGFPYIWDTDKEPIRPSFEWTFDYRAERARKETWDEYQKSLGRQRRRAEAELEDQGLTLPASPARELALASMLNSMRKGWDADRELARWIRDNKDLAAQWCSARLTGEGAALDLPVLSSSQMLNPYGGKGGSAPKTEWRPPNSLPASFVDPFSEWMKIRGMWRAMVPCRAGGDFKFFVLEPANITLAGIERVRSGLQAMNLWGGIRLDIEATLRCAELLILHSEPAHLEGHSPRSIISGLRQAYFMSLGTAAALMNDAFFPLPDWFVIREPDDADAYLEIIRHTVGIHNEDRGCLASLDDSRSDDGSILQQYRQWLLSGELMELLDFHAQFATHIMQKKGAKQWVREFSTHSIDTLLIRSFEGRYPMREIIQDAGFLSLARAVRNSTIYAFSLKNRQIHFGLAQRLKQKMKAGEAEFCAEIGEFVQNQNWEVTSSPRLQGRGHIVKTADLDSFFGLVHSHGCMLVGSLLLAYGYAKAPKIDGDQQLSGETDSPE